MLARRKATHVYTAVHLGSLAGHSAEAGAPPPGWASLVQLSAQRVLCVEHMQLGKGTGEAQAPPTASVLQPPPGLVLAASNVSPATVRQRLLAVAAPLTSTAEPAASHMWVGGGKRSTAAAGALEGAPAAARMASTGSENSESREGGATSEHFMPSAAWVKQLSRASSAEPPVPSLLAPAALEVLTSDASAGAASNGVSDANAVLHWRRRALLVGVLPPLVRQFIERYGLYGLRFASAGAEAGVRVGWLEPPLTSLYKDIAQMAAEQQWDSVAAMSSSGSTSASPAARCKHVAVLGGSFHPITAAHLSVAADVAADEGVSEVWIVPCGARPDKPSLTTAAHERLLQCVLAAEHAFPSDLPVYVMPLEVAQGAAVPSYVLLSALATRFKDTRFSLVIGMDLVPTLPSWTFAGGLLSHISFLVVPRPGYDAAAASAAEASTADSTSTSQVAECMQTLQLADGLPTVEVHLSSSEVRGRVKHMVAPVAQLQGAAGDAQGELTVEACHAESRSAGSAAFSGVRSALCGLVPPYVNSRLLDAEPGVHPRKQLLALTDEPDIATLAASP